jgi:hypothetical protein
MLCLGSSIAFSLVVQRRMKSGFYFGLENLRCLLINNRSEEDGFSRALVIKLIDQLETEPLPHLTPNEHAHLLVLIQTTLEVRSLDLFYDLCLRTAHRLTSSVVH